MFSDPRLKLIAIDRLVLRLERDHAHYEAIRDWLLTSGQSEDADYADVCKLLNEMTHLLRRAKVEVRRRHVAKVAAAIKVSCGVAVLRVGKATLVLTGETVAAIDVAVDAIEDEDAVDAGRPERDRLTDARAAAVDAWAAARERAFGQDTGRGWDQVAAARAALDAAERALADFDAACPEVVAEIKAEQSETTARFLAAD